MIPIDFEQANITYTKPKGWKDEECSSLPAYKGNDTNGKPFIMTAWQPNKEDIEAITAGKPIWLFIIGESMPPVSICTTDEFGEFNL